MCRRVANKARACVLEGGFFSVVLSRFLPTVRAVQLKFYNYFFPIFFFFFFFKCRKICLVQCESNRNGRFSLWIFRTEFSVKFTYFKENEKKRQTGPPASRRRSILLKKNDAIIFYRYYCSRASASSHPSCTIQTLVETFRSASRRSVFWRGTRRGAAPRVRYTTYSIRSFTSNVDR